MKLEDAITILESLEIKLYCHGDDELLKLQGEAVHMAIDALTAKLPPSKEDVCKYHPVFACYDRNDCEKCPNKG